MRSYLDEYPYNLTNIDEVVGIKSLNLPMPANPTYFTCVLHNGIHSVETPASRLEEESLIDQEFELYVILYVRFLIVLIGGFLL